MTQPTIERRAFGTLRLRGRIWWLRYRVDGKEHWESSKSTSQAQAEKLLRRREAELGAGLLTAPDTRRVTFEDMATILRDFYRVKGRRSLRRAQEAIGHLADTFDMWRAVAITTDRVSAYEADRLAAGAGRATVNYELAILRRMFNLAIRAGRLTSKPAISTPAAQNARTGFFEPEDFAAVLAELPEYLRPVMQFAYLTGWRVPSEVLRLTWDRVDFQAGLVRLDPNTTKTDRGRVFPFDALPALAQLLREQRERTTTLERATDRIIAHVFHRHGQPITDYYHAWRSACRRAAHQGTGRLAVLVRPQLVGRVPHDFRRTAVRNLVRAGVPEHTAMQMTGHRTRAIFDRYDIVNEADLRAGASRLATYLDVAREGGQALRGTIGGQSGVGLSQAARTRSA